jgi:hypothetical protein
MQDFEAINASIKDSQETIKKAEALLRLKKNPDFAQIILGDYLKDYAAELVQSKANMHTQDEKQQKFIDGQIAGVGHFVQYMDMVLTSAVTAQANIESQEAEREYMLNEEIH